MRHSPDVGRRRFLKTLAGSLTIGPRAASVLIGADGGRAASSSRPNILWLTCEDMSPNLGCYGDAYAVTPHLDRLATQSVRYTNAFAPIGVCAPARSTLITGMYASSIGTHPMRCAGTLPEYVRCFSEYLRQAGYYCTNNVKTDYNFKHPKTAWDDCSASAHWRGRAKNQPFFAVFNYTQSHESQIRLAEQAYRERIKDFTPQERHDPAKAPLPPYHPDTPEVRKDWARYYDMITVVDREMAKRLRELDQDGLADETIVFFFADHGAGMPRSKRWLYDSSLRVPLLIRFPPKYQHLASGKPASVSDRLVGFVDFGPTVLSLAGVKVPPHMQGRAFLGEQATDPRDYIHGFRDRMDERTDCLRCVRDRRFKYIRNYMPHRPWFHEQHLEYGYQMPTLQVWQRLADEGKLTGPAAVFMAKTKPPEELYDTQADPWEVNNLAGDPMHREVLERLRGELRRWMIDIRDLGFLPEAELRTRFGRQPPYEVVRRDPSTYPQEHIIDSAELASRMCPENLPKLVALLSDRDAAVRYWAVVGLLALANGAEAALGPLGDALRDTSPDVRLAAAEALCRIGRTDQAMPVLVEGLKHPNEWVRLEAANILDRLDEKARPALQEMQAANKMSDPYVHRVLTHALQCFGA